MKYIKRLSLLLALLLAFSLCLPTAVFADDEAQLYYDKPAVALDSDGKDANAIVVYCIDDGHLVYENHRLNERVDPSAATKLVAAMVVADYLALQDIDAEDLEIEVSEGADVLIDKISSTYYDSRIPMMGFQKGDTATAKDLLNAMLISGHNDAAIALACHIGGDMETFVAAMNQKVAELGLENTHFANCTGLPDDDQYTTPYEVALISAAFYKYNDLVAISDAKGFIFKGGSRLIPSKNGMVSDNIIKGYENDTEAIGIVAGQLDLSAEDPYYVVHENAENPYDRNHGNYCLVVAGQKDGKTYIYVVMCAPGVYSDFSLKDGNAYEDMESVFDWSRNSMTLKSLATTEDIVGELRVNHGESTDHVMVYPAENVELLVLIEHEEKIKSELVYSSDLVYKDIFNEKEYDTIDAPVEAGQCVGKVHYYYEMEDGSRVDITTVDAVVKEGSVIDPGIAFLDKVGSFLKSEGMQTFLVVILGLIGAYIVIAVIMFVVRTVIRMRDTAENIKNKKSAPKRNSKSSAKTSASDKKTEKTKKNSGKDNNSNPKKNRKSSKQADEFSGFYEEELITPNKNSMSDGQKSKEQKTSENKDNSMTREFD